MIDFTSIIEAAARDPLVLILGLYILGGLATYFLFNKHPIGHAVVRVILLILLTIVLLHADIVPYQPLALTGSPFRDAVHAILKIAWWFWAAWFLVSVLRAFVVFQRSPREAKLLQDLLAGLIYLAAVFATVTYVFDLPIRGLLATSGVVAIVLGLALQSTLGDVFSGIVLNFSRPYRPGDWISIEGGTDGRVIELNWRATYILTARRDLAILPNSTIAKSKIVNVSSPSGLHGTTITVQVDARTPPSRCSEILDHAIRNSRLIVGTPPPTITIKTMNATCTEFEIAFFVEELASTVKAQNELFDFIYRHLAAADISLAVPQNGRKGRTGVERLLELVEIFATFEPEERAAIAAKLKQRSYDEGETLIEPGIVLQSLFIIGSGVVSFTREGIEGEMELLRLGPGDHFGEIGMLTGAGAIAKLSALTPTTIYELAKADLTPILEARPRVSQELCRALARRQAAGQLSASPQLDESVPKHRLTDWFSDRIHQLYNVVNVE
ncbi:MAG: mechanosensitive ion channel family protein [Alphaproteobacteria bacterium]|nr:mechanosensitive ion channel family protein [Alphaproteobacteria bacterium]